MNRFRGAQAPMWAALAALWGCDDGAPGARDAGSGAANSDVATALDARADGAPSGGASGAGDAQGAGGGRGADAASDGADGAPGTGGAPGPAIRGSTNMPCLAHTDCSSGMCIANFCDAPGCGPTPGITEVCDDEDNDCDAIADNAGACAELCSGTIFEGHAYMFCPRVLPFYEAEAVCASKGMHLVRIDSAAERDYVGSEMIRRQIGAFPWIGATDRGNVGIWRWLDGTIFWRGGAGGSAEGGAYTSWATGQPSDGGQDHSQRCVQQVSGGWNDLTCGIREYFVCEVYSFAPNCADATRNGTETGIDCGGSCSPCPDGEPCQDNSECQSQLCVGGSCTETCSDNVRNGTETDVDCGGACRRCAAGEACTTDMDCGSRVCQSGTCADCVEASCSECDDGYTCCTYEGACGCQGLFSQACGGGPRP